MGLKDNAYLDRLRERVKYIWMNGALVDFDAATLHVLTAGAFFGANVFEGLRAYWNEEQGELYAFKLDDHFQRLEEGMKMMRMTPPYDRAEMLQALIQVLRANGYREDVQLVQAVYVDEMSMGQASRFGMYIAPRPLGRRLAKEAADLVFSSWTRSPESAVPFRIKCGANYQNSRLPSLEAAAGGYDAPLLGTVRGKVSESSGATFFLIKRGRVVTPGVSSDILESITRDAVIRLFEDELGLPVTERDVDRTEVYMADEAFLCGSAWEIMPVASLDRLPVGDGVVGPVTRELQSLFFTVVRGRHEKYREWITPVYGE